MDRRVGHPASTCKSPRLQSNPNFTSQSENFSSLQAQDQDEWTQSCTHSNTQAQACSRWEIKDTCGSVQCVLVLVTKGREWRSGHCMDVPSLVAGS